MATGLTPAVGALGLTGTQPNAQQISTSLTPLVGALGLTGSAPVSGVEVIRPDTGLLFFGLPNDTGTGTLAFTGYAPGLLGFNVRPSAGALFFGMAEESALTPSVGTLTFTGRQANPPDNTDLTPETGVLRLFRSPQPGAASLGITGLAAQVAEGIHAQTGTLGVTGAAPTMAHAMRTTGGSMSLAGAPPNLQIAGPASLVSQPHTGTLAITGLDPQQGGAVRSATGSLGLSGNKVVLGDTRIEVEPASLAFTTYTVTLPGDPRIPVGTSDEGCSLALVSGTAQEGCASVTGALQEGCAVGTAATTGNFV
jgi:hypothetical protein